MMQFRLPVFIKKLKNISILSVLLCFHFCCVSLKAQNYIDLLNTGTNIVPENKYENSDTSFSFMSAFFNIQYPHVFENKDVFLTKLSVNHYQMQEDTTLKLYNIYLQLGLLKHLNEKTSLEIGGAAKIASQMKDIDGDDFIFPLSGVIKLRSSEKFTYGFGVLYSYEFFGHFFNPVIYAKWEISDSWSFLADYPSHGHIMYHKDKKYQTGLYISSSTTSLRLSDDYNSCYMQKGYADCSWLFDLYLTKNIVLRTKLGYSSLRALDIYGKDDNVPLTISLFEFDDNRTQLSDDIEDALFFEISLNYRYHY